MILLASDILSMAAWLPGPIFFPGGLCLGGLPGRDPLDRDPQTETQPGQRPSGQIPPRQRLPDRDTPRQRPPGQILPGQRSPLWTEMSPGQRPPDRDTTIQ